MFTGMISDLGRVRRIDKRGEVRFDITTSYDMATVEMGASIACNGVCLTVIDKGEDWFAVQASTETVSKTTLDTWCEGQAINLERALKVGDELGGHIVSAHVDGVATVVDRRPEGDSQRFRIKAPDTLKKYVAPKGSVTLDGVSLTVNEVDGACFGVNIIPHTQSATTFGTLSVGDAVNMEIDMLARYVARLMEKD